MGPTPPQFDGFEEVALPDVEEEEEPPKIPTASFLSSAELTEKNIKVLIVLERSMRWHKAFCSCAQKIIHKVSH